MKPETFKMHYQLHQEKNKPAAHHTSPRNLFLDALGQMFVSK